MKKTYIRIHLSSKIRNRNGKERYYKDKLGGEFRITWWYEGLKISVNSDFFPTLRAPKKQFHQFIECLKRDIEQHIDLVYQLCQLISMDPLDKDGIFFIKTSDGYIDLVMEREYKRVNRGATFLEAIRECIRVHSS
ncbi:MAG: hypothetical protein HZA36_02585 [Parcubacteria group bacterium]|nr:hypothetical protein [Parcubacteria group bacterium]